MACAETAVLTSLASPATFGCWAEPGDQHPPCQQVTVSTLSYLAYRVWHPRVEVLGFLFSFCAAQGVPHLT